MEVKEYKGVAYFKDYKDARAHMEKYASDVSASRIVNYTRGWAVQVRISGPYLNKDGKVSSCSEGAVIYWLGAGGL